MTNIRYQQKILSQRGNPSIIDIEILFFNTVNISRSLPFPS